MRPHAVPVGILPDNISRNNSRGIAARVPSRDLTSFKSLCSVKPKTMVSSQVSSFPSLAIIFAKDTLPSNNIADTVLLSGFQGKQKENSRVERESFFLKPCIYNGPKKALTHRDSWPHQRCPYPKHGPGVADIKGILLAIKQVLSPNP